MKSLHKIHKLNYHHEITSFGILVTASNVMLRNKLLFVNDLKLN